MKLQHGLIIIIISQYNKDINTQTLTQTKSAYNNQNLIFTYQLSLPMVILICKKYYINEASAYSKGRLQQLIFSPVLIIYIFG